MLTESPSPFSSPHLAAVIRKAAKDAAKAGELPADDQFTPRLSELVESRHRAISDWLRAHWPPGCVPEDWIAYYGAQRLLRELRGLPDERG